MLNDFDEKADITLNKLKDYYEKIVNSNDMIVSIINEQESANKFFDKLQKTLIAKIYTEEIDIKSSPTKFFKLKEAYKTSSNVNYVVKSADLKNTGLNTIPK